MEGPPPNHHTLAGSGVTAFSAGQMTQIQQMIRDAVNQAVAGVVHAANTTPRSTQPTPPQQPPQNTPHQYTSPYANPSLSRTIQTNLQSNNANVVLSTPSQLPRESSSRGPSAQARIPAPMLQQQQQQQHHQPQSQQHQAQQQYETQTQAQIQTHPQPQSGPACRPPTEMLFPSRDIMISSLQAHSAAEGYAIVIRRSRKAVGKRPAKVYLKCDRGGQYVNSRGLDEATRKRNIGSRLIGCPFKGVGIEKPDGQWQLKILESSHNHGPSLDMATHPSHRRAFLQENDALRDQIEDMTRRGVAPRKIMESLKEELGSDKVPLVITDLYNARQRFRRSQAHAQEQLQLQQAQ